MKKGIGPRGLGTPKSAVKMYDSPAKKMTDPPQKKYDETPGYFDLKAGSFATKTGETAMLDQAKRRGGYGVGAENKAISDARKRTKRVHGPGRENEKLKEAGRNASFDFRADYKEQQGQANKYSNLTGKYVYTKPENLGKVKKNIRRKLNY
jgi:hypothetical protein